MAISMEYEKTSYPGDVNILKRPPFEAIPLTVDMLTVSTFNDKGKKIVKAGTLIKKINDEGGEVSNTADATGVLLHDITVPVFQHQKYWSISPIFSDHI